MNTIKSKIYFMQSFGLNVSNKTWTVINQNFWKKFNKNQISRSVTKLKRKKDANIPVNKTIKQSCIWQINHEINIKTNYNGTT